MLKNIRKKKAQGVVEYVVLLVVVIGALLAMGNYFKRGVQGRWKAAVDDMGEQYDPRFGNTSITHTILSNTVTQVVTINGISGLWTRRIDETDAIEKRNGYMAVGAEPN